MKQVKLYISKKSILFSLNKIIIWTTSLILNYSLISFYLYSIKTSFLLISHSKSFTCHPLSQKSLFHEETNSNSVNQLKDFLLFVSMLLSHISINSHPYQKTRHFTHKKAIFEKRLIGYVKCFFSIKIYNLLNQPKIKYSHQPENNTQKNRIQKSANKSAFPLTLYHCPKKLITKIKRRVRNSTSSCV